MTTRRIRRKREKKYVVACLNALGLLGSHIKGKKRNKGFIYGSER